MDANGELDKREGGNLCAVTAEEVGEDVGVDGRDRIAGTGHGAG